MPVLTVGIEITVGGRPADAGSQLFINGDEIKLKQLRTGVFSANYSIREPVPSVVTAALSKSIQQTGELWEDIGVVSAGIALAAAKSGRLEIAAVAAQVAAVGLVCKQVAGPLKKGVDKVKLIEDQVLGTGDVLVRIRNPNPETGESASLQAHRYNIGDPSTLRKVFTKEFRSPSTPNPPQRRPARLISFGLDPSNPRLFDDTSVVMEVADAPPGTQLVLEQHREGTNIFSGPSEFRDSTSFTVRGDQKVRHGISVGFGTQFNTFDEFRVLINGELAGTMNVTWPPNFASGQSLDPVATVRVRIL